MQGGAITQAAKVGLIAMMAIGSLLLWFGSPIGWLWIASQIQRDSQAASLGPYALVIVGIAVTAVVLARGLSRVNRLYGRVSGQEPTVRVRMPWHRSMRGEEEGRPPQTVLDVVMVISVSLGAVALTVWFFLFAGSPLPGA